MTPMTPMRVLPDLQCCLVCDSIRQEANGNLILLGVMDKIISPQFPVNVGQLAVFHRWTAGKGQFIQKIRVLAPDQTTVLHTAEARFSLPDPMVSATNVLGIGGFQFTQPGPYSIEVLVDDVLKLRFTLPVFKLEQPQQPETPPTTT